MHTVRRALLVLVAVVGLLGAGPTASALAQAPPTQDPPPVTGEAEPGSPGVSAPIGGVDAGRGGASTPPGAAPWAAVAAAVALAGAVGVVAVRRPGKRRRRGS